MEEIKKNERNEIKDNNIFLKIKSIQNFINKDLKDNSLQNNIDKEEEKKNIYIKYLENPNIIFQNKNDLNNENLKLVFKELIKDMEMGNNILFPFLDIFQNLVKAYIESDLDDINNINDKKEKEISSINESVYLEIFEKLKNNIFISKEILFPIYDYFKNLYDILMKSKELKEEDFAVLKKFNKTVKLFQIFYEKNNNIINKTKSSLCFIGGTINIEFNKELELSIIKGIQITIKILNNDFICDLNKDLYLIKINDEGIKYNDLKKNIYNQKLSCIKIKVLPDNIEIFFEFDKKNIVISEKVKLNIIKSIILLENFYGQVSSIELSLESDRGNTEFIFLPNSIRKENKIFYTNINNNNSKLKDIIPKIKINNQNLIKNNYINYNDKKFDIIEYFGGILHFLPFYQILKKLNEISNEKYDGIKDGIIFLFNCIIKISINYLFSIKKRKKIIEKYLCFFYYLCLDLDLELNINLEEYKEKKSGDDFQEIYNSLDLVIILYYNQKNIPFSGLKLEINRFIENLKIGNFSFFKKPIKGLNQLYKEYMERLFCFNSFWSKRNIFFPKRYNISNDQEYKIKYKQINYYTKNFQLPYFSPILEFKKYYPKFSSFKGNLFGKKEHKILEYDFELNANEKAKRIITSLISGHNDSITHISENCCLVKNTHHIIGKLSLIKNNSKSRNINIIFRAINKDKIKKYKKCNKNNINKNAEQAKNNRKEKKVNNDKNEINKISNDENSSSNNLCYGAAFPCPEKEFKRNIIIKSKNILFILIRVYFKRLSAIEIFTINKSYYFNFQNCIDINNLKMNKILNAFINSSSFKEIKLKNEKLILGYYNIKYKPYLFPLFEDEINNWEKKVNYFCNYDIISLINVFSNRSLRDVYQYPIYPLLYNPIGKRRQLDKHIGIQEFTGENLKRTNLFFKNYKYNEDDSESNEEVYLFNIHYSNPSFVFNFLFRVFPYSFLSIEFQGDGFDSPNRLFFSVEASLNSSLNVISDLREFIPELYYMIELFYNKNKILLDKLNDGRKIDNVFTKGNENIESDIKRRESYAQFLFNLRKNLENENINKWIDLIFGIKQKYYVNNEGKKYQYYEKNSEILFKNDNSILANKLEMDRIGFGLLPYKLLNKEFPNIQKKSEEVLNELKTLNKELFFDEHMKVNNPVETFICKGRILIDENYIKIIEPHEKLNILGNYYNIQSNSLKNVNLLNINNELFEKKFGTLNIELGNQINLKYKDKMSLVNYYFLGNAFGIISIYALAETKKNDNIKEEKKNEEKKEKKTEDNDKINKNNKSLKELKSSKIQDSKLLELKPIISLNNHIKEIKYIDFNPRLNVLLSYSLDNFINIYIFFNFKLINVIDTFSFKDENDKNYFDEVVLLSFPFPSIVCHNKNFIYMLTINGELIKYEKLEEGDKVIFSIDKNIGIIEDQVEIYSSQSKLKQIFNFFIE